MSINKNRPERDRSLTPPKSNKSEKSISKGKRQKNPEKNSYLSLG